MRLLHLTDLHMRQALIGTAGSQERLSRDIPVILDRLEKKLDDWTPDIIAITGDLLDVPDRVVDGSLEKTDPEQFQGSIEQSVADYCWIRAWLEATGREWIVIPGNHDHRGAFYDVFGGVLPDKYMNGWRFVGFDDELDDARSPFRPKFEMSRFVKALEPEGTPVPQIHLQHYILSPRVVRRSLYSYSPGSGILDRTERSGVVRCTISGHFHPGAFCRNANGIVYSTAPAFCERPFPIRLVDFDRWSVINVMDRTLD